MAAGRYWPRQGPTRLDHVAIGVPEVAAVLPCVVGELGGRPAEGGLGLGPFRWWQYRFAGGGVLELLEPHGEEPGFLHRFLAARGAGVHHLTFKVPDLRGAALRAAELGYDVLGFDDREPGWMECFLHPKQAQGVVVQFAESRPEFAAAQGDGSLPFPPAPEAAPEPFILVGVRLSATSAERARRQWRELLGGREQDEGGALAFHWPDSPLRVVVDVDPGREEGVLCLEWAPPPGVALEPHTDPLLGTRLEPVA